jgi:hypothetical protein
VNLTIPPLVKTVLGVLTDLLNIGRKAGLWSRKQGPR